MGTQILSWLTTLVVARLLAPEGHGIFGMALVYVRFAELISEFGLGAPSSSATISTLTRSPVLAHSVFLGLGKGSVTGPKSAAAGTTLPVARALPPVTARSRRCPYSAARTRATAD